MNCESACTGCLHGLGRARAAMEALGLIDLPAAVLGLSGQPLAANSLFKNLMPHITHRRCERLAFCDPIADTLLTQALAQPAEASDPATVRAIPIRARGEQPPMIVHFVPACGEARNVFAGASCVLIITLLKAPLVPGAEVLQGLFDLTPAEARVARGIAAGQTVVAIADGFGLSRETVRSQLKAVLGKTRLVRQAELVALLAGCICPAGSARMPRVLPSS
jgi:DNA-binding CsgD family transcriptional regulator